MINAPPFVCLKFRKKSLKMRSARMPLDTRAIMKKLSTVLSVLDKNIANKYEQTMNMM